MAGDETVGSVFIALRDHLARIVSRIVPPHEIEDIVQETYVRACQLKSYKEIRSPQAYMTRIAHNLALDHVKRAESRLTSPIDEQTETDLLERRPEVDEPFRHVASAEEFAHFCEAVRNLPVQCRRVFVLKKVYGHSQQEIATHLNISVNTVEKHIAEGLRRCTYYMRKHFEMDESSAHLMRVAASMDEGGAV